MSNYALLLALFLAAIGLAILVQIANREGLIPKLSDIQDKITFAQEKFAVYSDRLYSI